MTFSPIPSQPPPSFPSHLRPQVSHGGEHRNCILTAIKIATFIAGLGASIGAFVFLGPIAGIVTSLGCMGLLSFCANRPSQPHLPLHQRFFSFLPTFPSFSFPYQPHVRVGEGHTTAPLFIDTPLQAGRGAAAGGRVPPPHVLPGGGHVHPQVPPGGLVPPAHPHVLPGGGHIHPPGHPQVPPGGLVPPPHSHVLPGGGHTPPPGHPHVPPAGRVPPYIPPPSGPPGHVPVGRDPRR
jgi:hypothetical protein